MNKYGFVFLAVAMLVIAADAKPAETKYTTKYDNINLHDILHSDRLLKNYVNCLKGTGKCSPDGKELKKHLPDALETECAKCSEKQKTGTKEVITFLVNDKPDIWRELETIYDPDHKYAEKYRKVAEDYGIKN